MLIERGDGRSRAQPAFSGSRTIYSRLANDPYEVSVSFCERRRGRPLHQAPYAQPAIAASSRGPRSSLSSPFSMAATPPFFMLT
jgi:hypothetical protein